MSKWKTILAGIIILGLMVLYGYKLLEVPTGLTLDEASFAYNAALIAQDGRDQNGRLLPLFVLTSDRKDWRQPVTQYYLAGLFFVFGPSLFWLRFSSVLIAVGSILGVYLLGLKVMSRSAALIGALVMTMTPLIMIQAHLGLDNIMPIPFTIMWLWSLYSFEKNRNWKWLVIAGISLGIGFYTYKGMRAIVPVWVLVSSGYIWFQRGKNRWKNVGIFFLVVSPFFFMIPLIERFYAGAILGNSNPQFNNIYEFFLPYFSSFDFSYLFIKGDIVLNHSTGKHGMLLLSSLPLILLGVYGAIKEKGSFFKLVLVALIFGPMLYGMVGSVHRFSRLMALIPLYSLLAGRGFELMENYKAKWIKGLQIVMVVLMLINFKDFINYYWKVYPGITYSLVGEMDYYRDVKDLALISKKEGLKPVIHQQVIEEGGEVIRFLQITYFGELLPVVPNDDASMPGTLLLSARAEVPPMEALKKEKVQYFLHK